jgi:1-acyl-sn-glycerol-3-phosphate acyltransferase
MILYRTLHVIGFRRLLRTIYRIEVAGGERIPERGPVILVSNHESIVDPFVLGVATPRPIRYMAKSELFRNRPLAWAMEAFGAFPIVRGGGDSGAMDRARELLDEDQVLGMFPQGTSKPWLRRGWHRGAARLALDTGAPIVPVCMVNTEKILRPGKLKMGLPRVRIIVGEPIRVEPGRPTIKAAKALTERVESTITELRRPYGEPAHLRRDS